MSELRYNPVTDEWVVVATARAKRPDGFANRMRRDAIECPFCPGREHMTPPTVHYLGDDGEAEWQVRVFENKYPAFTLDGKPCVNCEEIYRVVRGSGRHEVLVLSRDHAAHAAMLAVPQMQRVARAYVDRYRALSELEHLRYITIITNQGHGSGATLEHPHSQIFALPMVPKAIRRECSNALRRYKRTGKCITCQVIEHEADCGDRLVFRNEHFACFMPYASAFPFELSVAPLRHMAGFADMTDHEVDSFAAAMREANRRIYEKLDDPPYNAFLHSAPLREEGRLAGAFHWDWHVRPCLTTLGGFEHATGLVINASRPEDCAKFLREGAEDEAACGGTAAEEGHF
ncbi:MAG: galactose-1-phosphate uridylyltransferase [Armatimonadota bacterium]|nr:MAG: galactose-1-phosphate uridylyltransferase [Armatimonadota bacterium]